MQNVNWARRFLFAVRPMCGRIQKGRHLPPAISIRTCPSCPTLHLVGSFSPMWSAALGPGGAAMKLPVAETGGLPNDLRILDERRDRQPGLVWLFGPESARRFKHRRYCSQLLLRVPASRVRRRPRDSIHSLHPGQPRRNVCCGHPFYSVA